MWLIAIVWESSGWLFGAVIEAAFRPLINMIRPSLNQSRYLRGEQLYLCSDHVKTHLCWLRAIHLLAQNNFNKNFVLIAYWTEMDFLYSVTLDIYKIT